MSSYFLVCVFWIFLFDMSKASLTNTESVLKIMYEVSVWLNHLHLSNLPRMYSKIYSLYTKGTSVSEKNTLSCRILQIWGLL